MNDKISDIELIERYLDGKLSPDEVLQFHWRLEEDREFARKFRVRKAFPSLLQPTPDLSPEARQEPQATGDVSPPHPTPPAPPLPAPGEKPRRMAFAWIGAGLFLIAGLVLLLVFLFRQPEPQPTPTAKNPANEARKRKTEANLSPTVTQTASPARPIADSGKTEGAKSPPQVVRAPLELLYPAEKEIIKRSSSIEFKWRQDKDSLTNFYVYTTNNNHMVYWRGIKPGVRSYFVREWTFRPGQYYWYVGTSRIRSTFTIVE